MSELHCPYCQSEITTYQHVATCNKCGTTMHADCAAEFDYKCVIRACAGKMIIQPDKTQISVSGTNAKEVQTVISSLLKQFQTTSNESKKKRVSILFLAAEPTDTVRLRLGLEIREIQEKIQLSKSRELFSFAQRMSVRPVDISQALLDIEPNIVHFSGHGTSTGALCFESQDGSIQLVSGDILSALFAQFSKQVQCIVLNACYSEIQAQALVKHVNYVIGMNNSISDKAAIAFAIGFYQALGANRSIENAYQLGCVQIGLQGISERQTPILLRKK